MGKKEGSPVVGIKGRGLRMLSEAMPLAFSHLLFEKEKRTNAPHPKHDFVKIIQLSFTEEYYPPHTTISLSLYVVRHYESVTL